MQDSFDITTLIFIVLAVFVIWRLRSVLGQKTGNEQPPFDPLSRRDSGVRPGPASAEQDNVVRLPGANGARPAAEVQLPPEPKDVAVQRKVRRRRCRLEIPRQGCE